MSEREKIHSQLVDGLATQLEILRLTKTQGLPEPAYVPDMEVAQERVDSASSEPAADLGSLLHQPEVAAEIASSAVLSGDAAALEAPSAASSDPKAELSAIREDLGECTRCKLHQGRSNIVFGQGSPEAQLVFVGEAPGYEEDKQGLAFVGKAGELLTKMISAMGYTRDEVFICNIVKCRPPKNRDPQPDEVTACEPFLKAQLAVLQPVAIVALGKYAAQTLLQVSTPISRMRGQWREYQGIALMPTFHPAYLLRNPSGKKDVWQDLQEVMRLLGKTV